MLKNAFTQRNENYSEIMLILKRPSIKGLKSLKMIERIKLKNEILFFLNLKINCIKVNLYSCMVKMSNYIFKCFLLFKLIKIDRQIFESQAYEELNAIKSALEDEREYRIEGNNKVFSSISHIL